MIVVYIFSGLVAVTVFGLCIRLLEDLRAVEGFHLPAGRRPAGSLPGDRAARSC